MPGFRALARNRDFTLLWTGEAISSIGTTVSTFAFPLVGYAITGSAMWAAMAEAAFLLGMVGSLLPAGALADRIDRRRLMRGADGLAMLLFGSLALAGALGHLTLPHLLLAALGAGVASGVYSPAESAAIRTVVATEDLPTAFSQNQAREGIASLLGGPIGGVLYAAARWMPFLADAVSYAVGWLLVGRIRTSLVPPERGDAMPREPLRTAIAAGLRTVRSVPLFRVLLLWAPLVNLTLNALVSVSILRLVQDHRAPLAIGLVEVAFGASAILGSIAAPYLIERIPTGLFAILVSWIFVPLSIPLALWSSPAAVGGIVALGLFLVPAGNAGIGAYRVAVTRPEELGRVQSVMQFVSMFTMPLAAVLAGALLTLLGARGATYALGAAIAAIALIPTLSHSVRSVPRPAAWPRQEVDTVAV